jgi:mono/diheme cytochrome c family protein
MNKFLLTAALAVAGWSAMTLSAIRTDTIRIARDEQKVAAVKAALTGMACQQCHGSDALDPLPIRRTLDENTFKGWIRGTRSFSGYNLCPSYAEDEVSNSQIAQIYRILYKSQR